MISENYITAADSFNNIGKVYLKEGNFREALLYL